MYYVDIILRQLLPDTYNIDNFVTANKTLR